MTASIFAALAVALAAMPAVAQAQSCSLKPSGSIQPSIASGYQMQVVATGLAKPRGIAIDSAGNLLVVQQKSGKITAHTLNEQNGCVTVGQSSDVTQGLSLNHGIEISSDGKTLYGSSTEAAYSWDYDSSSRAASNQKVLVTNMTTSDHTTRTLLLSKKAPGMMLISRGSTSNIDFEATMLESGHSQVKAFNLTAMNGTAYNFDLDGERLGWGLRNDVGVAEHPSSGGIYTVENSADQLNRSGVDIHENNPAEELNYLGPLTGATYARQGDNYGYPWCFTAWQPSSLPNNGNLTVGSQFAIEASSDSDNQNKTDEWCAAQVPPRLSFQAHMAPLDIKFNNSGTEAWITWHGSWNRDSPSGYKLSVVSFTADGEPTEPANSTTAAKDIFANQDNSKCPDDCFRPVAMVIDKQGRIFMTSDASGEIYMITKTSTSTSNSSSGNGSSTSGNGNSGAQRNSGAWALMAGLLTAAVAFLM